MEAIIVSIITGICVAVPNLVATILGNKKNSELIDFRINDLEKKVEKHNSIMERTFKLEEKMSNVEKEIVQLQTQIKV